MDIDRRLRAGLRFAHWWSAFAPMLLLAPMQYRQQKQQGIVRWAITHRRFREDAMKTLAFAGALTACLLMGTALTPVGAADMTHQRALDAGKEPHNWLLHYGNYEGWRFSPLKQINTDNVKNLKVAFTVALGGYESGGRYKHGNLQGTPIVEDGMMYVTDGWGSVYAIDVSNSKKATIKWKFDPGTDRAWAGDVACCGVNNRGVALWKDKIISISLDGRLFSLNKATGEMLWERKVADPAVAETLTLAPLVIRDIAIVGVAGGEYGVRGWIDGTDLNTGKQVWRTYTIPGPGEPGHETWKDGKERYKHGGGSVWMTATYDPETDTFYQGIGNAGPDWDPEYRPGDNKWAASVLALNPADGKIKWGFQYTPNDPYDYDEISEHQIINAKVDGQDRKLVVHAARNGFYYVLDRVNGSFVLGKQYVDQLNWTPGLDPSTTIPIPTSRNTHRAAIARGPIPRATGCARRTTAARTGSPVPTIPISICCSFRRSKAAIRSRRSSRRTSRTRAAQSNGVSGSPAVPAGRPSGSTAASRHSTPSPERPKSG
jgi:alcohol dehydrogenase (cytochrome c)